MLSIYSQYQSPCSLHCSQYQLSHEHTELCKYACTLCLFVCLQTTDIFKLMDKALDDKNRISFAILQESGRVGSEGVLNNMERYALYVAEAMRCQVSGHYSITGNNIGVCNAYIHLFLCTTCTYTHVC